MLSRRTCAYMSYSHMLQSLSVFEYQYFLISIIKTINLLKVNISYTIYDISREQYDIFI